MYGCSVLAPDSTLHPRLGDDAALAELRQTWAEGRSLRVEQVLAPGLAEAIAAEAMQLPFVAHHHHDEHVRCLFWRCELALDAAASLPEPLQRAQRFLQRDLPALATAIRGDPLRCPPGGGLVFRRFRKGSYFEPHDDHGPGRVTAYVLGLTRERWPAEQGGHLEFLAADRQTTTNVRPPGFETLDLYDVLPEERWLRIPLLSAHVERLTLSGYLSAPEGSG